METVKRLSLWVFYGLLAYMPLHIFLSTWLGASFGVLEFAKAFKDVVLLIGFAGALAASLKQPWFKQLLKDKLVWLIAAYAAWTLLLAAIKPTDADAEILGVVYNLRFLLVFLYGLLLTRLYKSQAVQAKAIKIVLTVATIVLAFGVIQYTVLPDNTLSHLGYHPSNGVFPAFFIDAKPDLERTMSTLRDPNSFGSYIIIIGILSLVLFIRKNLPKLTWLGYMILSSLCLWFTFSRSAWIGFAIGILACLWLAKGNLGLLKNKKLGVSAALVLIFGSPLLYISRNTYLVQNVVFHADASTTQETPNQLRTRFWQESAQEIADHPFGHGPGTAGLTSIRNDVQGAVLNENYYLQIAYEAGLIGLAGFLAIIFATGRRLFYQIKFSPLALGLLASFIGLFITNLLVHIWSNEAVAYTWWGLAGTAVLLNKEKSGK